MCGETLDVFDGVVGGVEEELADEMEAFVVGDVGCGFLGAFFAFEVLMEISRCSTRGWRRLACWKKVRITAGATAVLTVAVLKGMLKWMVLRLFQV